MSSTYVKREYRGWTVTYRRRTRDELWGRFGGGWQWEVGFQLGGSTLWLNCLVFSVSVSWPRR